MLSKTFFKYGFFQMCTLLLLVSCSDFLELEEPDHELVRSEVFNDYVSATAALNGIYGDGLSSAAFVTNFSIMSDVAAGLLESSIMNENYLQFLQHELNADNTIVDNVWLMFFKNIYRANSAIEGLGNAGGNLTETQRVTLMGEAYFVRAFCYFYLVNFFGEVPLIVSTNYEVNNLAPKQSAANIYSQILSDLQLAFELLPADGDLGNARPTRKAALSLLARVHLYLGDWEQAQMMASEVIANSNLYTSWYLDLFKSDSEETIWQLVGVDPTNNTGFGSTFIPISSSVIPNYFASSQLLIQFESYDERRAAWFGDNTLGEDKYVFPFKYRLRSRPPVEENLIVLRLSEQYLIRAEARTNMGMVSEALQDLNMLRKRAGLGEISYLSGGQLRDEIKSERQREFFTEWAHCWFDQKRLGRLCDGVNPLWPVPRSQLLVNPNLTQNEGY